MPRPSIQSPNPIDFRSRVVQKFQSIFQGLVRGKESLQKQLKMNGKATKVPSSLQSHGGSAETIAMKNVGTRAAPNLDAKRLKVVSPITTDVNKSPKDSSLENRKIGVSGRVLASTVQSRAKVVAPSEENLKRLSTPKVAVQSKDKLVATKGENPKTKSGATSRVSAPKVESKETVAQKVSGDAKLVSASKVIIKASGTMEKKKEENSASKLKPPVPSSPASKAKEKMEADPLPSPPTTKVQSSGIKLKLGGGTQQKACADSNLKKGSTNKVVEPSTKRLATGSKPSLPKQLQKKMNPTQEAVQEGKMLYLKWDEQGFLEEQDSKLGEECFICERDLSYAPVPPETDTGTYNFPEAAVLPCGHIFHMICLEMASTGISDQPVEPTCFLC
ncbi:hypothetical protein LINPERHAP1_LOCUS26349 [Linum perenne]